ncbi:hypothetical protein LCGC14_2276300, partial [marine sediment metagenome]
MTKEDQKKLDVAAKALRFYAEQRHYDTVKADQMLGPETQIKVTRILDTGAVAQ